MHLRGLRIATNLGHNLELDQCLFLAGFHEGHAIDLPALSSMEQPFSSSKVTGNSSSVPFSHYPHRIHGQDSSSIDTRPLLF